MEEEKKDYMTKVKEIVDTDKRQIIINTTKGSVNGAVVGLIGGMMVGYYRKQNVYLFGLIGAVSFGLITAALINREQQ